MEVRPPVALSWLFHNLVPLARNDHLLVIVLIVDMGARRSDSIQSYL